MIEDREIGWLIERQALSPPNAPGQHPIWWVGEIDGYRWTTDANRALRFPTKDAAENRITELSGIAGVHERFGIATEHVWIGKDENWDHVGYQERALSPSSPREPSEAHQWSEQAWKEATRAALPHLPGEVAGNIASAVEAALDAAAAIDFPPSGGTT